MTRTHKSTVAALNVKAGPVVANQTYRSIEMAQSTAIVPTNNKAGNSNPLNGRGGSMTVPASNPGNNSQVIVDVKNRVLSSTDREQRTVRPVIEMARTGAAEVLPQVASALGAELSSTRTDYDERLMSLLTDRKMNLSSFLEELDPSYQYSGTPLAETDAYERQLMAAGIRVKSVPEKGIYADKVNRFFQSNVPGSQVLFPEFINRVMRQSKITPDILPYIIAVTTGIQAGDAYRTIATNDTQGQRTLYRVEQGAEMAKTTLTTSEKTIRLFKYGRILEGSYEYFRQVTIDLFGILLSRMAMQASLDKADTAIDVAINGDGNANAATNYNQSTLDTGVTPTFAGYLAFRMKFWPYTLTTLVGNETSLTKYLTMTYPNTNPLSVLAFLEGQQGAGAAMGTDVPQPLFGGVQLVLLKSAPSGVLIGLDRNYALEYVVENGASIVETDRLISSQRNQIAISEKVGFAQIFQQAIATWTWNA